MELNQEFIDAIYSDESLTLQKVMDLAGTPQDFVEEITDQLGLADRYDLLEQLKDDPDFGLSAKKELAFKQRMDDHDKWFKERVNNYPSILKQWHETISTSEKIGIWSISYPCASAIRYELGDNYVAVSGDGIFLYMFEVISLEGNGKFSLAESPIWGKESQYELKVWGERYESGSCKSFREVTGANYGDVLTGTQILEALQVIYHPNG